MLIINTAIVVMCEDIPDPDNGQIVFGDDTTCPFDLGTTATYSCYPGYSLVGDAVRTCEGDGTQEEGTWSNTAPQCDGEYCRRKFPTVLYPCDLLSSHHMCSTVCNN